MHHDLVALERGVEDRVLAQGAGDGEHEVVGDRCRGRGRRGGGRRGHGVNESGEIGDVDLGADRQLRTVAQAGRHAVRDRPPHLREWSTFVSLRCRRGGGAGRRSAGGARLGCLGRGDLDVLLDDAAAGTGTGHGGQVDAELLGQLARDRAGEYPTSGLWCPWGGRHACRRCGRSLLGRSSAGRGAPLIRRDVLSRAEDEADQVTHRHRGALRLRVLQDALGGGLDLHVDLVGLDHEEGLASFDSLAVLGPPHGDRAGLHGESELGHDYASGHGVLVNLGQRSGQRLQSARISSWMRAAFGT